MVGVVYMFRLHRGKTFPPKHLSRGRHTVIVLVQLVIDSETKTRTILTGTGWGRAGGCE